MINDAGKHEVKNRTGVRRRERPRAGTVGGGERRARERWVERLKGAMRSGRAGGWEDGAPASKR
jgi:hypothetical protein